MCAKEYSTSEAVHAKLFSDSRWNMVAFAISMLSNFLTIPVVINRIGLQDFGTAGLMLAMFAPLMLVGTVLGQATVRALSLHLSTGDLHSGTRVFSAAIYLCFGAAILILLVLAGFGDIVISLTFDDTQAGDYERCMIAAGIGWGFQQFVLILQSAVIATQKFRLSSVISIFTSVVSAAFVIGAVMIIPTPLGYLSAVAMGFLVSVVLWILLVKRYVPSLFSLRRVSDADYRAIIDFGKWQGISQLVGNIGLQMDRYVLGAVATSVSIGQYNVAMRLQEAVHIGVLKASEVLFPHFSATGHYPVEQRASFFVGASWLMNTFAACALAPLIPLSWHLIALWVDEQVAQAGSVMLCSLTVAGILGSAVNVYQFHAMGVGEVSKLTKLTFITSTVTAVFTLAFIVQWGPLVAGLGIVLGNAVRLVFVVLFSRDSFGAAISLRGLALVSLPPLLAGLLVAFAWKLSGAVAPTSWIMVILDYLLVSATVAIGAIALTLMSVQGRRTVWEFVSTVRRAL